MRGLDCVTVEGMKTTESTEVFAISNTNLSEQRRDLESQFSKSYSAFYKHSIWWALAVDVPLLVIVLTLLGLFELNVIPSYQAGFFCNDSSISFKFEGDTVTTGILMTGLLPVPFIVIFVTELVYLDPEYLRRGRTFQALINTVWLYRSYLYGFFFNLGVVEVLKGITGSPRPTFLDICQPDAAATCRDFEYVSSFTCTSTRFSSWLQTDSYHSFPSGHTSLSVYAALFVSWYLQRRAFDWRNRSIMLVPVLQMSYLSFAAISSMTRITDRRHHWWDVLTGLFIGVASLFHAVLVLCKNFAYAKPNSACDATEEGQQKSLINDAETQYVS